MSASVRPLSVEVTVSAEEWRSALSDAERIATAAAEEALRETRHAVSLPAADMIMLGITLTDDAEQRQLNHTWRGKDASTNVLAFPALDSAAPLPVEAPVLLGDVVLAYETVAREASEQQKPFAHHFRHLVVHGVLHLLGFDHETDTEAAIMESQEIAILAHLGVPNPYREPI